MDPIIILVENLRDALAQLNQYLGLGLVAAISAFVLDREPATLSLSEESTDVPGLFVKMPRHIAQLVLLGIYFVAGIMAYMAADAAVAILSKLPVDIRSAACLQASIATSEIGYRVIAVVLPILFVLPILWRRWKSLRTLSSEGPGAAVVLIGFFMVPYLSLGLVLFRVSCNG